MLRDQVNGLFPAAPSDNGEVHEEFLSRVFALAATEMPHERLDWAKIEFSLRRLQREHELEAGRVGDYRVMIANPPWHTAERQGVIAGSRWSFSMDRRDDSPIPRYVPFPFFLAQAVGGEWVLADPGNSALAGAWMPLLVPLGELGLLLTLTRSREGGTDSLSYADQA